MGKREIDSVGIFEKCWNELVEEFSTGRVTSTYCSEADVQLHLACKLLNRLPARNIHVELPIPLDVQRFKSELWAWGRTKMKECVKADVAIIDPNSWYPHLIAELKFTPLYWGFDLIALAKSRSLDEETASELKQALKRDTDYIQRMRQQKPTKESIEKMYLGVDKQGRTTAEKMISIINDFKRKEQKDTVGYLCVIDELYPNISEILQKTVKKYDPPDSFKIRAVYLDTFEVLMETLRELQ